MRLFAARGMELLVAQSYSKNLGLYAERIGAINVVCTSADAAARFFEQNILCFVHFLVYGQISISTNYVCDKMNKCTTSPFAYIVIFYNFAMSDNPFHMPAGYISGSKLHCLYYDLLLDMSFLC